MIAGQNARRRYAVALSRQWKALLSPSANAQAWGRMMTALVLRLLASREAWRRWCYRAVFTHDGRALRTAGEKVLGDLRDFCFARASAFDPDPIIMARRQGRRDVWLRVAGLLELDEAQVQTLMEIDDGY